MSKQSPVKRRGEQTAPTSQQQDHAAGRPVGGSSQRATAVETPAPHSTRTGGSKPDHERIAVRAYQLWEAQGCPGGTDLENWFEAERLLREKAR